MVRDMYRTQEFTVRDLACIFKVSRTAIWRYLNEEVRVNPPHEERRVAEAYGYRLEKREVSR